MARSEHHPCGLIHYNPQLSYRGYTLFSANRDQALLIDMEGRIVHQWHCPLGVTNPVLMPNGNLTALAAPSEHARGQRGLNGQSAACYELDWAGNIVWRYDDPWIHHDYERLPNGNTLIIKWSPLPKSLIRKIKGGYVGDGDDPQRMLGDLVIQVNPAGKIVDEWKSWQHLDPATEVICPLDHRLEWSHCNSLSLSPSGDWLLSFRRFSMVGEVSTKTGKFKWKLGDGTTAHQHDAKYSRDDRITIFDNGVHRKGIDYSRVIEIDVKTRKIVWEYADDPPFSFYTVMGGSVDRLPNDNMLVCETSKGQLFEVTRSKKVVWEYINPFFVVNPRLGGRINMIFRAHRYGPEYSGLKDRDLDPNRYANMNRLYAA
jgi:Arylsulfotransferase (ASST)